MNEKYKDIIDLPHHTSEKHPRMSLMNRAAQFATFAALVGYDDALDETARLTDTKLTLSDDIKAALDTKQALLADMIDERPQITVTYFETDKKKAGGTYRMYTGNLKRIEDFERQLQFTDGMKIRLDDVYAIDSELFRGIIDE